MGAYLSSPQLTGGLVYAGPAGFYYGQAQDTSGPFTSAFTVEPSDTNSFGFAATMTSMNSDIQARYTDTARIVKTATCSAQITSYGSHLESYGVYGDGTLQYMATYTQIDSSTAYGSILCPIANTQIGDGPLVFS
ncbi:unnamed protein product [Aureobasidium uvarum]|uniref:Uncharacterized protein n=1 Tax=Aureobasidium uvarum TaxID=2773716 RepID=A0A9N8KES4_9PEZI|nr:unnamed protein product [Aureobasidium uvarum]